jgi:hypothetical protein
MLFPVTLQQRVSSSDLIVEGEVLSTVSYWNAEHNMIYTAARLKVYKVFKGSAVNEIEIITEGGRVGNDIITVTSTPEFNVGGQGIYLCMITGKPGSPFKNTVAGVFEAYAGPQGVIQYDLSNRSAFAPFEQYADIVNDLYPDIQNKTGITFITVELNKKLNAVAPGGNFPLVQAVPTISNFTPTTVTAGTRTLLTINGTNFGATRGTGYVSFKNANNGGSTYVNAKPSDYKVWNNTQIQVWVPSQSDGFGPSAGTGTIIVTNSDPSSVTSAGILTVNYSTFNVDIGGVSIYTEHINDNTTGGYTFRKYTGFAANAPAVAAFNRAFNTWKCNTNVNWVIGTDTSLNATVQDNHNIIRFDIGGELPAGVGGRCIGYLSACAAFGSDTVVKVTEIDVIFDDGAGGFTWQYGPAPAGAGQVDFETVAVHELGHGMLLDHIILPGAVMHYTITTAQNTRTLNSTNDIAGGNYVMTKSFGSHSCKAPSEAMLPLDIGAAVSISAIPGNTICSGTNVTFTATAIVPVGTFTYQWKLNGSNVGINSSTYSNAALVNGDVITCVITVTGGCNEVITSNAITMAVNPVASVSITSNLNNYCYGPTVTFTATPVNGGSTPVYQWKLNGNDVGTNNTNYSSNTLLHGDVVSCVMTSNATCVTGNPATSNSIIMAVVKATISASPGSSVCSGQSVTFNAVVTNSSVFIYTWRRNGSAVGSNSPTYFAGPMGNGEAVWCEVLTSPFGGCSLTSNLINMTVNPFVSPAITINAITPTTVCPGQPVAFQANITNGGSDPVYQWQVNGVAAGSDTNIFSSTTLPNGALVRCLLFSNAPCLNFSPAISNNIGVTIKPTPVLSITGNPDACSDEIDPITLTSNVAATSFTWGVQDVFNNLAGEANCGGACGTAIAQAVTNSTAYAGLLRYTVSGNAAGCLSAPAVFDREILPMPYLPASASALPSTICAGETVQLNAIGVVQSNPGFAGDYDPANFNTSFVPAGVGGSVTESPDTIVVVGGSNSIAGSTFSQAVIPATGTVSLAWQYTTTDVGSQYDRAHYYINGVGTTMPGFTPGGALSQSGVASINVTAGQVFGFGIFTTDGLFGAGVLKVYFFNGPVTGTVDWYSLNPSQSFIINELSGVNVSVIPTEQPVHQYQAFSAGNGCTATSGTTLNVNVNALPVGTVNNQSICDGGSTNIQYATMASLSGISWTTSNNPLVTGNSNCGSGCSAAITQTLNNSLVYKGESVNYFVTAMGTNGCSFTDTATVVVLPAVESPDNGFAMPDSVCLPAATDVTASHSFPQSGFAGYYDASLWSAIIQPPASGGSHMMNAETLTLVSGNTGTGGYYEVIRGLVMGEGSVYFEWSYTTADAAQYDFPVLVINGVETLFTGYSTAAGAAPQSGSMLIALIPGQIISFRMWTTDGIFGSATCNITNFWAAAPGIVSWWAFPTGGGTYGSGPSGSPFNVNVPAGGVNTYYAQGENSNGCVSSNRIPVSAHGFLLPNLTSTVPASANQGDPIDLLGISLGYNPVVRVNNTDVLPITSLTDTQLDVDLNTTYSGIVSISVTTACGVDSIPFLINSSTLTLNLSLFLQGFYTGGSQMTPVLTNNGISVNPTEVDTIQIELRDPLSPATVLHSGQSVLHVDGTASMTIPSAMNGLSAYIVVRHRNSLETWSKLPVTFGGSLTGFDFTTP